VEPVAPSADADRVKQNLNYDGPRPSGCPHRSVIEIWRLEAISPEESEEKVECIIGRRHNG
jgi:hypothetical protein